MVKVIIYKIQSFIWILETFKNWWVYSLGHFDLLDSKKEYVLRLRNGLKIIAKKEEFYSFKEILFANDYGIQNIRNNSLIVDIGANIGIFSLLVAHKFKNVKVYAFEPDPKAFSRLSKNILINQQQNSVRAFNLAIGAKKEFRDFYVNKTTTVGNSFYIENIASNQSGLIKVEVITLKDVFKMNNIAKCDFLKIDCEGAEYEIILSADSDVFSKIETIVLEYHLKGTGVLIETLQKNNFICTFVDREDQRSGILYASKNIK